MTTPSEFNPRDVVVRHVRNYCDAEKGSKHRLTTLVGIILANAMHDLGFSDHSSDEDAFELLMLIQEHLNEMIAEKRIAVDWHRIKTSPRLISSVASRPLSRLDLQEVLKVGEVADEIVLQFDLPPDEEIIVDIG